jgi:hypothetical protein
MKAGGDRHSNAIDASDRAGPSAAVWLPAIDSTKVRTSGTWEATAFRHKAVEHLWTEEPSATVEVNFRGSGLVLKLGGHAVPAYGEPNLGNLEVSVDGMTLPTLYPLSLPREIVLARDLEFGDHHAWLRHRPTVLGAGCRLEGFYALTAANGDLAFELNGEDNSHFGDARAVLTRDGKLIRAALVRNWLNGHCRVAGLPPATGYTLRIQASGWEPHVQSDIQVFAGREETLPPVFLKRNRRTRPDGVRFPTMGYPTVLMPGSDLRSRLVLYQNRLESVKLVRHFGPATITRELVPQEDVSAAFYYDHEFRTAVPQDTPPGLYDLVASVRDADGRSLLLTSPRSVHVVSSYPREPVLMTFGHLDTWGEHQAEYLHQVAHMANLLAPDMVLISNEVNPAYVSGALQDMSVPYAVTFGNHQFAGHQKWFGDAVGAIDFGNAFCVVNVGCYWHEDITRPLALLDARKDTRIRIINALEHNAPVRELLDRHAVSMIHDAHGPGPKVMEIGTTPTVRVGKVDSESFLMVRFQGGQVDRATYLGSEIDPIPFARNQPPPARIEYSPANDGRHGTVTATATNDLDEHFPNCRAVLVMPAATAFTCVNCTLEQLTMTDDHGLVLVTVRFDLPARDTLTLTVAVS